MQITFLGTSSGVPTLTRNVSSVALRLPQRPDIWLFDCGEGTQHQFLKSELRISQIRKIFISHMHGDHIYGLPGLLSSIGLSGTSKGIDLYGPHELQDFVYGVMRSSSSRISYPMNFYQVENSANKKEFLLDENDFCVKCTELKHRIPSYAYRVNQKPRPGRFDIEKAKSLEIPPGPIYAALKRGERVQLKDGRKFNGKDFCGESKPGLSMVYCTDTVFTESAIEISSGTDLLIHESTFSHQDSDMAYQRGHSTSTMAAQIAAEAGVGKLVLTHLSPRYAPGNRSTQHDLLNEAKAIFANTLLAKDFLNIEIKKTCNSS